MIIKNKINPNMGNGIIGKRGENLKSGCEYRGGNGRINELQLMFYNDLV